MLKRLIDALYLCALGVFVFLGMTLASFHGDETYHIFNSRDYFTLLVQHRPQDLLIHWMWESDLSYHRLLDSGVSRYTIGLAWQLAGFTGDQLPGGGYIWSANYEDNVNYGLAVSGQPLYVARIPSTLFTALSVGIVFLIGRLYGGRPLAYFGSALYALNPVILLNGRRAMQEGSLLFFGLTTIYLALVIALKREAGVRVRLVMWISLITAGALTLYSKNSGFIYTVSAYLAIFVPELLRLKLRPIIGIALRLALCTFLTLLLFFAMSPGLWNDPPARFSDMLGARDAALREQIIIDPNAPTTPEQRALDIIRQPFLMPPQHYELEPARYSVTQDNQIYEYMRSPLSGFQFGMFLGGILTALAFVGLIANALPNIRPNRSWALALALYLFLAVNVRVLMEVPLPWQRYYLSLIPVVSLFSGVGVFSLIRLLRAERRRRRSAPTRQPSYA